MIELSTASPVGEMATFRNRFSMYDYARGNCAREEHIVALLDATKRMGLDGLAVYFEDLAMFLCPEIYRGSIDLSGWRRLDREAARRGLVLLPLLNLYGHNEQTLAHPELSHLRDDREGTTLNLGSTEARDAARRTLDVAVDVFSSELIHIGFDEAFGLGYSEEQRTGAAVSVESAFVKHLNWVTAEVVERGRRPMFWADMPGVYFPHVIPDISRDLIAVDWFYRVEPGYPTMQRWIDHGFELWVAPTIGYTEMVWPDNSRSLTSARNVIAEGERVGASGIIFTAWEQGPFPFSARLPAAALQAELTTVGGKDASLFQATSRWLEPTLGGAADRFAEISAELGKINHLLPTELKRGSPAKVRDAWYKCDPHAREAWAEALQILQSTSRAAAEFPDLRLAHRRFSLQAAMLSAGPIDVSALVSQARELSGDILDSWLFERTDEGYERNFRLPWDAMIRSLEDWPTDLRGPAPTFCERVLAVYGFPSDKPSVTGLCTLKDWDGNVSPEDESTSVWIWTEADALHLRFLCEQQAPARAVERSVDFLLTRDDLVQVCLDFTGRGEGYLWMEANPAGTMFSQWHSDDIILSQWHPLSGEKDWATPIQTEAGWGVEMAMPFAALGISVPSAGDRMGLTLGRRHHWNEKPTCSWGGMGWQERDAPSCLSQIQLY